MQELVLETGEFVTLFFRHDEKFISKVGEVVVLTKQADSIETDSEKRQKEEKRIIEELKKREYTFWDDCKIVFKEPPYWDVPHFGTIQGVISGDNLFVRDKEDKKKLDENREELINWLKSKNANEHYIEKARKMNDVNFFGLMNKIKEYKIEGLWKN